MPLVPPATTAVLPLFFSSPDGAALMSVRVETTGSVWGNGAPQKVIDISAYDTRRLSRSGTGRPFDVAPGGRRFLMIKPPKLPERRIIVIQHFNQELKTLFDAK